jgi:hypothetical protein
VPGTRFPLRLAACSCLAVLVVGVALSPPHITDCADVNYRQDHLAECNLPPELRERGGGGGPGGGNLLHDLLDAIGLGGLAGSIGL